MLTAAYCFSVWLVVTHTFFSACYFPPSLSLSSCYIAMVLCFSGSPPAEVCSVHDSVRSNSKEFNDVVRFIWLYASRLYTGVLGARQSRELTPPYG